MIKIIFLGRLLSIYLIIGKYSLYGTGTYQIMNSRYRTYLPVYVILFSTRQCNFSYLKEGEGNELYVYYRIPYRMDLPTVGN